MVPSRLLTILQNADILSKNEKMMDFVDFLIVSEFFVDG